MHYSLVLQGYTLLMNKQVRYDIINEPSPESLSILDNWCCARQVHVQINNEKFVIIFPTDSNDM